jgi:hypothetical protein
LCVNIEQAAAPYSLSLATKENLRGEIPRKDPRNNREMKTRSVPPTPARPNVNVHVSGKLFQGHLSYLDQLVHSAEECRLWPVLNLARLEELDRAALLYLVDGEGRDFGIALCPKFVREWMDHERESASAA